MPDVQELVSSSTPLVFSGKSISVAMHHPSSWPSLPMGWMVSVGKMVSVGNASWLEPSPLVQSMMMP